jgi:hypothetical protein
VSRMARDTFSGVPWKMIWSLERRMSTLG